MDPLYQRLKELDRDTFEKFCFHLIKEQYPSSSIRHVDGAAGDEGLDVFMGQLDIGPVVWQCKSFPNGVGESQKKQIRASLKRAVDTCSPRMWVLCLCVDMDAKAHRWFQNLTRSYASRTAVCLMQACDLVHQLIYRRTLREHFFPGAIFDARELRSVISKTGELSLEELAGLTTHNLDQYIKRLEERDARFMYEVTFAPDRDPQLRRQRPPQGVFFSVADGSKTIDVYPRDKAALEIDPPKFGFTLSKEANPKVDEFQRTGRAQEFGSEELVSFSCDLPLMPTVKPGSSNWVLLVKQSPSKRYQMRLVFGSGSDKITYEHVEFEVVRCGSDEAVIQSGRDQPFRMRVTIVQGGTGSADLACDLEGATVRKAQKFLSALRAMSATGALELYDLEAGRTLLKPRFDKVDLPEAQQWYASLVDAAYEVEVAYKVSLVLPNELTAEDYTSLALLRQLRGAKGLRGGTLTMSVDKVPQTLAALDRTDGEIPVRVGLSGIEPPPVLFGQTISTGPIEIEGVVVDKATFLENLDAATLGASVNLTVACLQIRLA